LASELDAMRRLHELTLRLDRTTDLRALLVHVLDAIVALHRADFGNIQLFDPARQTLRLVAQRGFDTAFESDFGEIGVDAGTSCGQALARGARVVIEDVGTDPRFAPFREAARAYGFRAAQSTPLFGARGEPLGMVSTYFREPRPFSDSDHRLTDLYARQASEAIVRHRREEALRASEARLQRVIETESVGILFFNREGTVLDANEAFLRMIGWPREEVAGGRLDWRAMTPPEWLARAEVEMERLVTEGRVGPHEKAYLTSDGRRRWMLFNGHDLGDGTIVGYALDISERKRAEAALLESEERFRLIVENARHYAIFITDADYRIVDWLPGAEAVFGWSAREAVGLRAEILFTPEDREAGEPDREQRWAMAEGRAPDVGWRLRKDGSRVFIDGSVSVLLDAEGAVRGFIRIGQDVTESRRAEDALRESEARFRRFGEASSDILWIRDAETLRWEYLSAAFETVYGVELESALAGDTLRNWLDLIQPEDRDLALGKLRSVARGERVSLEYRIRRASDGQMRWLRDTMFPLMDDLGRVQRIGGIGEDVTDEKETADRMTVLVGELQHRTRNLMAVVRSIAQRTARGSRSLQDFKVKFGDRMDALARVQALLSRLKEADRVAFDELLRDELRAHQGARVTLEGPSDVLLRSSTVQVLAMAIHELATNAMKYGALAQPKGRLTVRWRLEPPGLDERPRLRVEWTETGVTVPPASETQGGAGRELIERALPYQLDAETAYSLGEDGVRCVIRLPVSERTPRG
jgi:PAS domain S-box-containing protein